MICLCKFLQLYVERHFAEQRTAFRRMFMQDCVEGAHRLRVGAKTSKHSRTSRPNSNVKRKTCYQLVKKRKSFMVTFLVLKDDCTPYRKRSLIRKLLRPLIVQCSCFAQAV